MGKTFHIACEQCKQDIWVGQTSAGKMEGWLYTGELAEHTWAFLMSHHRHPLRFLESQELDDDSEEVEAVIIPPLEFGEPEWTPYRITVERICELLELPYTTDVHAIAEALRAVIKDGCT